MALFKTKELRAWRYNVQQCVLLINGEAISLKPENISGIEIQNNYYTDTFPIFKVNFLLDEDVYYKILKNKTSLKIKLKIQKYNKKYKESDKKNYKNNKKSSRQEYLTGTFVTIDDTQDVDRERDISLNDKTRKSKSDSDLGKNDTPLELYLYREETDTGVKKQINQIFQEVTMSSIIGYLFGESGIKNALVSPLENNTTYKEILLPPLTINKLLAHLDAAYGFYKSGSVIFFGIDRTYILNFKGGCTAYESGERQETCIYIPKELSEEHIAGGTIEKDSSKYYLNWLYDKVNFQNSSVSADVINGSDALVINPNTCNKNTSTSNTVHNGKANTAIIDDQADNPWLASTFTAQTSSNSTIIYGTMSDIDVSALTPNKKFTLIFEDQKLTNKYKGTYFLSSCNIKFVNDSGEGDFSVTASVEFRRMQ